MIPNFIKETFGEITPAGAFEDWNEIVNEEKRELKERERELRIERDTEAEKNSPLGKAMARVLQRIRNGVMKDIPHELTQFKSHTKDSFGYRIRAEVEKGRIEIDIKKKFKEIKGYRYNRTDYDTVIGIAVDGYYRDGRGYGQGHEIRSSYKASVDGEWNYKGFANKLSEKIEGYRASAERDRKAAMAEADKLGRKEALLHDLNNTFFGAVEGLSETKTDYSRAYGSGYNRRYGLKTDETAFRFKIGDDKGNKAIFKFDDDAKTVTYISISGKLNKAQLKAIITIIGENYR